MQLLPSILFFLILIAAPLFLSVRFGKRFEETVAVSAGSVVLLMFLCGILGFLAAGVYIVMGIALVLICLSVIALIRKRGTSLLPSFFTPAFLAFFLVFVFLLFVHNQRLLHEWDEFSHWGDVVKTMTLVDDFSTSPAAHSQFQSYVPGMALFQYLFQKLAMLFPGGVFTDCGLYFCFHLLAFIFLLPFFTVRSWKAFLPVFLLFVCIAVIPSFLQKEYLTSIYIDSFVGLLAGSGFALLFIRKKAPLASANLLIVCSMLVLSKDVGLLFGGILACAFMILTVRQKGLRKETVILLILSAAAVALPKILWEIRVAASGAEARFRDPIDFGAVFRVITQQDDTYLSTVFNKYFYKLFTATIPLEGLSKATVTYSILAAVLVSLLYWLRSRWAKLAPDLKKDRSAACLAVLLAAVLFLVGLPLIYMFRFSEYEAKNFASFDRYLSIVFDCLIVMVFLLAAGLLQEKPQLLKKGLAVCVLATLVVVTPKTFVNYVDRTSVKESRTAWKQYAPVVDAMLDLAGGEEKQVWIITQASEGADFWALRYGIRPCNGAVNVGFSLAAETDSLFDGDIWTRRMSAEEWRTQLEDFDYVLLWSVNDTFVSDYYSLFERVGEIDSGCIFSVDHGSGLLVREYPEFEMEYSD